MAEPKATDVDNENEVDNTQGGDGKTDKLADENNTNVSTGETEVGAASVSAESGIDAGKRIEIDLLTYETCIKIADAIAQRCKKKLPNNEGVLVTTPGGSTAITRAQALGSTLVALRAELESLAPAKTEENVLESGKEPTTSEVESISLDIFKSGVDQATALLTSIKALVEKLAIVDTYDSRAVTIDAATLASIVASRCLREGLRPVVIAQGQMTAPDWSEDDLLPTLIKGAERLRYANMGNEVIAEAARALLARVDEIIGTLVAPETADVLTLLHLLLRNKNARLLTVQLLAAGGSYRTRTHIFTALGLAEKLSFSAGAAIQFSLTERSSGKMVAGDLLFASSGRVRLPRAVNERSLGNLTERDPIEPTIQTAAAEA